MNITIIGGGNIGTLMAGEFAAKGHAVTVCASDPERWDDRLQVFDSAENLCYEGALAGVTDNLAEAVAGADMIWVTYPTFKLEELAERLLPLLAPEQWLGVVPGNIAEFVFGAHVHAGGTLFGLQRVHSVARLKERGKSVYMLGRRMSGLHVAALPTAKTAEVAQTMRDLFDLPVAELPNYLVETLTPSNPILHTTRIRTMFRNWTPGITYDHNILFYEEWDLASSNLLLACDDELQTVCRALERELGLDLAGVRSLRDHSESPDAAAMTAKISSIPGFKGLTSPMKESADGGWEPDFNSRYFKADFAYGLKAIRDIAKLAGVEVPNMDEVYGWYRDASGDTAEFGRVPKTLEDLSLLYR